jgi:hypothetical protein
MGVEERRASAVRRIQGGDVSPPAIGKGYVWLGDVLRVRHRESGKVYEVGGEVDRGEGIHEDGRFCIVASFWSVSKIGLKAWCCWYRFEPPSWDWMYLYPVEECEFWPPLLPQADTPS